MKEIEQQMKKIGRILGRKSVFRVGVDGKTGTMLVLSVDVLVAEREQGEHIPQYIG